MGNFSGQDIYFFYFQVVQEFFYFSTCFTFFTHGSPCKIFFELIILCSNFVNGPLLKKIMVRPLCHQCEQHNIIT